MAGAGTGNNVPGLESAPQFSQNVPGVQFPFRQEFTREGAAYEKLGEDIQGAAARGGEIYDEINRQQDISTASKNYVDAGIAHSQQMQNLKLTSPDGFMHDEDTGEVVKNPDGTSRSISQEYWSWADQDYQQRQDTMSPRAAAMFRQQMQAEIGQNTKYLQNQQLELQQKSADQSIKDSMSNYARDNDRSPYPDKAPYYQDRNPDGSPNLRGSTFKINSQLATLKLWSQNQGPTDGAPGMYDPQQVQANTAQRLSSHADSWVRSAVTDILENDTPRDHKNRVSTTAVQQVMNLRDVIEGKDPMSRQTSSKGLPTVNSSLTAEQADKWRGQLNSMLDGAKKIDRSDYEFHLEEMKQSAKSGMYASPDKLFGSAEFGYLVHAAAPLGLTPEEQLKNFSDIFSNAAGSSYGGSGFDLASEATKRQMIMNNMGAYAKAWPQYAGMLGAKFTGDMANAIVADATHGALSKLTEDQKQYQEDPAKWASGISSGYQNPTQGVKYRSPMMKAVSDQLYSDPSIFAPLKPMSNGKPLIVNAASTMKRVGAQGFGQGYEPNYLSKDAYEAWANKIEKASNPEQTEQMFQQLNRVAGADAGTVMDQLVKYGKLDERYRTAQNLPTSTARIAAYSDIMSKGAAVEAYTKSEGGETSESIMRKASTNLQEHVDFNNRLHGADSPDAAKANKAAIQTWASVYSAAMGVKGTTQADAARAANERIQAQFAPIATVQAQHNFLGFHFGSTGPGSRVQFSRPDLSPDQQQTIQQNLLKAQSEEQLSQYKFAASPVAQGAYDFNSKLTPKWVAEHPFIWYPVRQGTPQAAYRLQYQGMNADGTPNAQGYDVRVHGSDGSARYYEVKESDALKKSGH